MDKMFKIMIITGAAIILSTGIFVFHEHQVNAKWEKDHETALASEAKQQDQENAAFEEKANLPTVDELHPARYAVPSAQAPANQTPTTSTSQSSGTSSTQTDSKKETPAAPTQLPTQTPPTTTKPPVSTKPQIDQDPVPAITSLSDADIQRLQSYPVDLYDAPYVSFKDMYANKKAECDALLNKFSPVTLSAYDKAKVGWLTSPKLVYYSTLSQYCNRGILTLTFYGDNQFGLTPNLPYQCEVEYRLRNSVTNGRVTLKLESTIYLSGFKAVK